MSFVNLGSGLEKLTGYGKTQVRFGVLANEMIEAYVETGEPLDKAGAYGYKSVAACSLSVWMEITSMLSACLSTV